jgi:hypothetical protein
MYGKIMNSNSGYFSRDGVPYHSVETLMVEAPDYGHETTSETFSYYIWLTALNGWATGDFSDFSSAWTALETYIIPSQNMQPTDGNYNPASPAEYAPEEDSPSGYPVPLEKNVPVGVDDLNGELAEVYGGGNVVDMIYATHWLLDVDNIYGFGKKESGNSGDRNVYINTYQRGSNESVWRTIPQPEWEIMKYGQTSGNSACGFLCLFTQDPDGAKPQWRYTGAPDADARTIQATYWAIQFGGSKVAAEAKLASKLGDFVRYAMFDKYFKMVPCYSENCPGVQWNNGWNATFFLIAWYMSWGGNIGEYDWSWRIGASRIHQGYQNVMTAYALSEEPMLISASSGGKGHWQGNRYITLDFWQWLQSAQGLLAGGASNSWNGRYQDPHQFGITGYFNGLAYSWEPVYHDPPSNDWFGMNAWSQERNAEYYYVTGDQQSKAILDKWVKYLEQNKDMILLPKNDYAVPSTLNWKGQPETWTGSAVEQTNLQFVVRDWSKDVGVAAATAHTLAFYAAKSGDSAAKNMSRELLDRIYMYADDIGVVVEEARPDYIGNTWTAGFWEPVYVPSGYSGVYPNGDKIVPGSTFLSLRSWYTSDPAWPTVQQAKSSGVAPVFKYHRFWAQAEYAIACADYARLFPDD